MMRAPSLPLALALALALALTLTLGCGGTPPPPPVEPTAEAPRATHNAAMPAVSQELGSIDQKKVEQTFAGLISGPLENCHKQGRDRIEVLTGDVKVFLRIDGTGKMRYGFFEDSTIGDRDTEKCILGVFMNASWPKPEGGEAEVRSGFGWGAGGEREPTNWPGDKVTTALGDAKDVQHAVDKCKSGVKGEFRATAYVEEGEAAAPTPKHGGKPKPGAKPAKQAPHVDAQASGRFKAIGIAPPNKDGAEKVDCIVDALRGLVLPTPGSYLAKVSFSL